MPDLRFTQHFSPPSAIAGIGPTAADFGFAAMTGDPGVAIAGTGGGVAGTLQLRRLSLPGVMVPQAVVLNVTTVGAVLTAAQCFAGLWDSGGNLIGLSADQSGLAFITLGIAEIPLVNPAAIDTPFAYVGWWFNGTTGPFLLREGNLNAGQINGAAALPVALARSVTGNTGLTTVGTAPAQLGALTKNATASANFWAAVE